MPLQPLVLVVSAVFLVQTCLSLVITPNKNARSGFNIGAQEDITLISDNDRDFNPQEYDHMFRPNARAVELNSGVKQAGYEVTELIQEDVLIPTPASQTEYDQRQNGQAIRPRPWGAGSTADVQNGESGIRETADFVASGSGSLAGQNQGHMYQPAGIRPTSWTAESNTDVKHTSVAKDFLSSASGYHAGQNHGHIRTGTLVSELVSDVKNVASAVKEDIKDIIRPKPLVTGLISDVKQVVSAVRDDIKDIVSSAASNRVVGNHGHIRPSSWAEESNTDITQTSSVVRDIVSSASVTQGQGNHEHIIRPNPWGAESDVDIKHTASVVREEIKDIVTSASGNAGGAHHGHIRPNPWAA